jgi:hypothetical protein
MTNPYETGRFATVTGLDQVAMPTDVARIVEQMREDLLAHPAEWENHTLDRFLDALAACLETLPALYTNRGEQLPAQPTWKLFADVLVKATGYE